MTKRGGGQTGKGGGLKSRCAKALVGSSPTRRTQPARILRPRAVGSHPVPTAIIPRWWTPRGAWRSFASCAPSRDGWRARTPRGGPRTASPRGCAASGARSRSSPPTCTRSTGWSTASIACSGSPAAWSAIEIPALGFGLVLLAATSMYLDLNYRVYLRPLAVLPSRLAERGLPRAARRQAGAADRLRARRLRAQRRGLRPEASAPRGATRQALSVARAVPVPVLGAGAADPAARGEDGRDRFERDLSCCSSARP